LQRNAISQSDKTKVQTINQTRYVNLQMNRERIMTTNTPTKIAIVTGGSRGIGAAIAKRLAADGMAVVVNFANRPGTAGEVVREINHAGGKAIAMQADVSQSDQVAWLFEETIAVLGGVDVLINNAGVLQMTPIAEFDDEAIDRLIDINLKGSLYAMREAANRLRDGGRIINLSTSVIGMKLPNYGIYAATKAAVEAATAILAKELRGRNITVNALAPGPTATDLFLEGKTPEFINHLSNLSPLERLGTPEDIANAIAFLAGKDGAWVNGQVLRANGGAV
jgi:3-oxoacyl-[acyl-carrier protein] reductase